MFNFFNFKQLNFFSNSFFFTLDVRAMIRDETSSAATLGAILKHTGRCEYER